MRLPPDYVVAIKTAAREAFGDGTVVRLFGSRVRDDLRGGDIDLHVEVDPLTDEYRAKIRFEDILFTKLPPQKVDVVVSQRGREPKAFERIAYRDGVVL
ncbi:MAG: nucleotidyltransferase domain-containing protein [Pseudomonadota bacterium]